MSYYDTIEEDVARAKQILKKGAAETDERSPTYGMGSGGTIYGADTFVVYQLLVSFVEAIEAVGPKVCELAVRHERMKHG